MKEWHRFAPAAALLIALSAPLSAQEFQSATNVYTSGVWFSSMAPGVADAEHMKPTWLLGLQTERWMGTFGLRLNGSFSEGSVTGYQDVDLNSWMGDADLLFRIPSRFDRVLPYGLVGAGFAHFNVGATHEIRAGHNAIFDGTAWRPVAVLGLGADVLPTSRFGFRIEAVDHVVLESMAEDLNGDNYGPMHAVRLSTGMSLRLGDLMGRPFLARASDAPTEIKAVERMSAEPVPAAAAETAEMAARSEVLELSSSVRALEDRVALLEDSLAAMRWLADRPDSYTEGGMPPLYTIQVAAFRQFNRSEAQLVAQRLRSRGLPVWVTRAEVDGKVYNRVRVGALHSATEAYDLGRMIARQYEWPVWVAPIAFGDEVPADAVAATRTLLGSR